MAKFNKIKVMSEALSTGVVPVFYHPSVEVSKSVTRDYGRHSRIRAE